MEPTKRDRSRHEPEPLSFEVTQEIDPAFAEFLRSRPEPTLTEADFDAWLPELPRARR